MQTVAQQGMGRAAGGAGTGAAVGAVSIICASMNTGVSDALSTPSRTCRRQANNTLPQTLCRTTTARIEVPASSVSPTRRNFSAVLHRRRRSRKRHPRLFVV